MKNVLNQYSFIRFSRIHYIISNTVAVVLLCRMDKATLFSNLLPSTLRMLKSNNTAI